ncbi:MAG: hypothetical protein DCF16_13275 [Alphaproteobacteria bacterium]|nr:MAG: hypothetical protein DCF16_13275 [Alphaproteobacteria bacterium]
MFWRAVLYPITAIAFCLKIVGAYWAVTARPPAIDSISLIALMSSGATILGLSREMPGLSGWLSFVGVAVLAYLAGLVIATILYAVFARQPR